MRRRLSIRVGRVVEPRTWSVYLRSAIRGWPTWQRTLPLSALDALDEADRRRRQGFEVRRVRAWVAFERTELGRAWRKATAAAPAGITRLELELRGAA